MLYKYNRFIRYVSARVQAGIATAYEIYEAVLILRDRVQLLLSANGRDLAKKQPLMLDGCVSLEYALDKLLSLKQDLKKHICTEKINSSAGVPSTANQTSREEQTQPRTVTPAYTSVGCSPLASTRNRSANRSKEIVTIRNRYDNISRGESLRKLMSSPIIDCTKKRLTNHPKHSQSSTSIRFSRVQAAKAWERYQRITEESNNEDPLEFVLRSSNKKSTKLLPNKTPEEPKPTTVDLKLFHHEYIEALSEYSQPSLAQKSYSFLDAPYKASDANNSLYNKVHHTLERNTKPYLHYRKQGSKGKTPTTSNEKHVQPPPHQLTTPPQTLKREVKRNLYRRLSPSGHAAATIKTSYRKRGKNIFEAAPYHTEEPIQVISHHSNASSQYEGWVVPAPEVKVNTIDFIKLLANLKRRRTVKHNDDEGNFFIVPAPPKTQADDRSKSIRHKRIRYLRINPKDSFVKNRQLLAYYCYELRTYVNEECSEMDQLADLQKAIKKAVKPSSSHESHPNSVTHEALEALMLTLREGNTKNELSRHRLLYFMQRFIKCSTPRRRNEYIDDHGRVDVEIEQIAPYISKECQKYKQLEGKLLYLMRVLPKYFEFETLDQFEVTSNVKAEVPDRQLGLRLSPQAQNAA